MKGITSQKQERWGIIGGFRSWRAQRKWAKVRAYIDSQGIAYDFVQSDGTGSVERLARMLTTNGYRTIVVIGSDGSLNDAINGILSAAKELNDGREPRLPEGFALGVVPCGIGNDFAGFWNLTTEDYRNAVDSLILRRTRRIDVGVCSYEYLHEKSKEETDKPRTMRRYFLNCVNVGLGARLVELTNRWQGLIGSKRLSLIPVFIAQIFERKSFKIAIKADTQLIESSVMSICIGNATGYGQTPNAVPYNAMLDLSVIFRPLWWQLFVGAWLLGRGKFLNYKNVSASRVHNIQIIDSGKAKISLDGRTLKRKPIGTTTISLLPEYLDFIINKD